jgi:hypothetical protein
MSTALSAIPRFNHVAISVDPAIVSQPNAGELLDFYGEVFGWTEMPTMAENGRLLVLRVHSNEQFVYLHAHDDPMRCPAEDHIGLSVSTPAELDAVLERARAYRSRDPRVEISDREEQDFKAVVLHSVYIRYRLPLRIELQCFDWAPGFSPDRTE